MKITQQLSIQTKNDFCTVKRNESGSVSIGSITLAPDELADFPAILTAAIKQLPPFEKKEIA